jgi:hypothetical protein
MTYAGSIRPSVTSQRLRLKRNLLPIPCAVDLPTWGAGFWPPVKVERPAGRTTLTGGQVPARLAPGRRRAGWHPAATTHPAARG